MHCACHVLNLALNNACAVSNIVRTLSTTNDEINFFRAGPKRSNVLKNSIRVLLLDERKEVLISLCNTSWVERHDALLRVVELFEPLIYSLNSISEGSDIMVAQQADILLFQLKKFDYLFCILMMEVVSKEILNLSLFLQQKKIDLVKARETVG